MCPEPQNSSAAEVGPAAFAPIASAGVAGAPIEMQSLLDIPVTLSVELGRVKLPLERVTQFAPGVVIELQRVAGEPVDVLVNGTPVARAEVVTVGDKYGIRIVELVSPEERLRKMARS
ncbi:MAG: flagellar motor switch protein FliN [Planctomycetes bacterium]|nr:flagellar motor switch protein FliN [Planctomycetota bacterium]